ncbi:hypothetical protein DFS34DRAFT_659902 [Phlyctochytrium arcticum]|nr:hypothetical protein DFS34DRAFT_659902 [Phlyctochytrium arcticum]
MSTTLTAPTAQTTPITQTAPTAQTAPAAQTTPSAQTAPTAQTTPTQPTGQYLMKNEIYSVVDLWTEWDSGFQGGLAIKDLERLKEQDPTRNWHGRGAVGAKNSKAWYRRKFIIENIIRLSVKKNLPEREVAARLESKRLAEYRKGKKLKKGATLQAMNLILMTDNEARRNWLAEIQWQ